MFKINDYVVYNSTGVYKIIDIRQEKDINNNDTVYYVLQPVYKDNLTIKTPVHNPKVLMRKVINKEDVVSLINSMPERETIWSDDDRQRIENFKTALRTGKSEEWIKIVKTIYLQKKTKSLEGKKIMKADEEIMKKAKKFYMKSFAVS